MSPETRLSTRKTHLVVLFLENLGVSSLNRSDILIPQTSLVDRQKHVGKPLDDSTPSGWRHQLYA